jgi:hypothetical protein
MLMKNTKLSLASSSFPVYAYEPLPKFLNEERLNIVKRNGGYAEAKSNPTPLTIHAL